MTVTIFVRVSITSHVVNRKTAGFIHQLITPHLLTSKKDAVSCQSWNHLFNRSARSPKSS